MMRLMRLVFPWKMKDGWNGGDGGGRGSRGGNLDRYLGHGPWEGEEDRGFERGIGCGDESGIGLILMLTGE